MVVTVLGHGMHQVLLQLSWVLKQMVVELMVAILVWALGLHQVLLLVKVLEQGALGVCQSLDLSWVVKQMVVELMVAMVLGQHVYLAHPHAKH